MRRTAGWVTVRLRGAVSGRQLTKLAEQIGISRVRRCGQETELTLRAADLNRVRHLLRGAGVRLRIVKKSPLTHLRPAARRHAGLIAAALTALLLLPLLLVRARRWSHGPKNTARAGDTLDLSRRAQHRSAPAHSLP